MHKPDDLTMRGMDEPMKMRYCYKHSEPQPMLSCKVLDGVTVGYYCASCYDFVPIQNPEIDLVKKFVVCIDSEETIRV